MSKKSGSVGNVSLINLLDPSPLDALPLSMCGSFIWITIKVSPNLPPHKSRRCVEYKDEYRFDLQKHCQDNDNNNRHPASRQIDRRAREEPVHSVRVPSSSVQCLFAKTTHSSSSSRAIIINSQPYNLPRSQEFEKYAF